MVNYYLNKKIIKKLKEYFYTVNKYFKNYLMRLNSKEIHLILMKEYKMINYSYMNNINGLLMKQDKLMKELIKYNLKKSLKRKKMMERKRKI